jgi:uncharacterized membrane protein
MKTIELSKRVACLAILPIACVAIYQSLPNYEPEVYPDTVWNAINNHINQNGEICLKDGRCWGKKEILQVEYWTGPLKVGHQYNAKATYSYSLAVVENWALDTNVQKQFPEIKSVIDGVRVKREAVSLTWECPEYLPDRCIGWKVIDTP